MRNKEKNPDNLRIIKTARDLKSINAAAKSGFFPLIKRVQPNFNITCKYAILQDPETGEIQQLDDFRSDLSYKGKMEKVIDWTSYYPFKFPNPYAAYLIPKDLKAGEKVWIEDLIEDIIGSVWNQGNTYRLKSVEAVWTGKEFEIDYDALRDVCIMAG